MINGTLTVQETIEYVNIATSTVENDVITITPTTAIKFQGAYYMFNPQTLEMEEQDFVEDEITLINGYANELIRNEKNIYLRKFGFDCAKEDIQQNLPYQPIQGLLLDSTYLTIKTENFCDAEIKPSSEDILYYQKRWWIIQETRESFTYAPKEKSTLHISLKLIKK